MSTCSSPLSSRSPTPLLPVQPDHFYGQDDIHLPPSPDSNGRTWLEPDDDPLAQRGIPVFKPTMDEFRDFEAYMKRVECWGMRSGIVKVIPPKEWTDALPPMKEQLNGVKLKSPIEQLMLGRGGLFRQQNVERRKEMSLREWAELCAQDDYRAPSVSDVDRTHARPAPPPPKSRPTRKAKKGTKAETTVEPEVKQEAAEEAETPSLLSPPNSPGGEEEVKPKPKGSRYAAKREAREAKLAENAVLDEAFMKTFDAHNAWLPPNTRPEDYTPEFCRALERHYWRNCGLGKSAWYGADTAGSLFTPDTTSWNVGCLPSMLARLLPAHDRLPGVNSPYLYFGMWRATFAWHVEDMDLFSINYIHFGAPKFWYAIPQGRSGALEQTMKGYFPKDIKDCPQFLRHKSFLASPTLLAQSSCRPNTLVQHEGEFVITYPMGYHAGFNLGFNCAESVNFALDSWLDRARKAKVCECVEDSVRIDVDRLLQEREAERNAPQKSPRKGDGKSHKKRKAPVDGQENKAQPKPKKAKAEPAPPPPPAGPSRITSIKLKLGPKPKEPDAFPCCLCVSQSEVGLLRVYDEPRDPAAGRPGRNGIWRAHDECASVVAETWVDEVDLPGGGRERVVFGVDGIVKDRWNLKCTACTKSKPRGHGAPIQCTKGKCPKAFHVSCAKEGLCSAAFTVIRQVEKEVVFNETTMAPPMMDDDPAQPSGLLIDPPPEPTSRVLKVIRKAEYQLLCHQHNPVVTEQKKSNKVERLRAHLLALEPMSRIKIRVSAGVFEVSLVRVIDETGSVEVVWDKGVKREFKFSSVVIGTKDGQVIGHKPTEIAPQPDYGVLAGYSSVAGPSATASGMPMIHNPYSSSSGGREYPTGWAYQQYLQQLAAHQTHANLAFAAQPPTASHLPPSQGAGVPWSVTGQYGYGGHYQAPVAPGGYYRTADTGQAPPQPQPAPATEQPAGHYRVQWQHPYTGPPPGSSTPAPPPTAGDAAMQYDPALANAHLTG